MKRSESSLIEWLRRTQPHHASSIELGIGDDMAAIRLSGSRVLVTSDMLLDGVHFECERHSPEQIGRKAIACSLSDCAAMAVRPVAAVTSVALPGTASMEFAQALCGGMRTLADRFECPLVGGDTTSWSHPLVIDVAMLAEPWAGCELVRRDGARLGDRVYITGALGGSLLGRHLDFEPRVAEARRLVEALGGTLHAMMDISDGLALDLDRMCTASGVGAELHESAVEACITDAARAMSQRDGCSPLEHALHDGEDFELLFAVDESVSSPPLGRAIGRIIDTGLTLVATNGSSRPLEPKGFEHFT